MLATLPWASRALSVMFWLESKTSGCPCLALICDVINVSSTMASPFNWIPLGVIFMLPIPSCDGSPSRAAGDFHFNRTEKKNDKRDLGKTNQLMFEKKSVAPGGCDINM